MSNQGLDGAGDALQRQETLSRWYDDGGAGPDDEFAEPRLRVLRRVVPMLGEPEMRALHVRVIALENLVIALLAGSSEQGREQARAIASSLVPRPGFTRHPLTIRAATRMTDLIDRAARFCHRRPS